MKHLSIRSRAPVASSEVVHRVMVANVGATTKPERELRRALHNAGLRFRKDVRPEPHFRCEADIVFPRQKLCVFVDGCFWHGCLLHFKCPTTNNSWWKEKIQATVDRDRRQTTSLESLGWKVLRVWEHDIEHDIHQVVGKLQSAIHYRRLELYGESKS
jgi:DNA mismatch endonuclease, patch repair protein